MPRVARPDEAHGGERLRDRPEGEERIVWAAFEVRPRGEVRVILTLDRDGDIWREERRWGSLSEAQEALGPGFGEVIRKVVASGSVRGRWRP